MSDDVVQQQIAYYRARAGEYDDWWHRRGRYDRGPEFNAKWFAEAAIVRAALHGLGSLDEVLELACGTGIWTAELLKISRQITAIDASPEVIEINRHRLSSSKVRYVEADLFAWQPEREFHLVFLGFWLSHVPPERLDGFLEKVRRSVRPGGCIFIVDSLFDPGSTAKDHVLTEKHQNWQVRKLNSGREFKVVKVFYEPSDLQAKLARFDFEATARKSGDFFLYAFGHRRADAPA
jgi:demethylmenaquinone methyltransferase/2-methoxy-6-polyprenyl-1,4-benzoquinol methylase